MEKINFQKELDLVIEGIKNKDHKPKLLLHSCCGPCSSYCLDYLKDYFEITVFYFNPNIYPKEEYDHRLTEQIRLIEQLNLSYGTNIKIIYLPYDHNEFLEYVHGLENEKEGGLRCGKCFEFRLARSYDMALEMGMDYMGTTLTVSPHKNAMLLNEIGMKISKDNVLWLPSDFKKNDGYKKSIELSKKYELYRQNYCGCEFSIWF